MLRFKRVLSAVMTCARPAQPEPWADGVHAGVWYRWFGGGFGGWQEPQLVFLDHGLIVSIPDDLRQHYCQVQKACCPSVRVFFDTSLHMRDAGIAISLLHAV